MTAEIKRALEAIVMVADTPVATEMLGQLTGLPGARVEELLNELASDYARDERGFQLVRVAGGWRYQSHPDQAPYIEQFVLEGQSAKLSAAALETLAIVAYKQPISRAQIASIRESVSTVWFGHWNSAATSLKLLEIRVRVRQ